jgi:hypothetical protein
MSARPNPKQFDHMSIYSIKHGWPNRVIPLVGSSAAFHYILIQTIATPTPVNFWGMAVFHASRAPGLFSGGWRGLKNLFSETLLTPFLFLEQCPPVMLLSSRPLDSWVAMFYQLL